MKNLRRVMFALVMTSVIALAGETAPVPATKATPTLKPRNVQLLLVKKPAPVVEKVKSNIHKFTPEEADAELKKYRGPLPEVVAAPVTFVADNWTKWEGWSLTGYSWAGLTSGYNGWRFKIGEVSGEMDMSRKHEYDTERDVRPFEDWESQIDSKPIFGFSFVVEF